MAKTEAHLIKAVLQELAVINAIEEPDSEDTDYVSERWATINANLRTLKISSWTDNSIPEKAFEPLVKYVAIGVASAYGVDFPNKTMEETLRLRALRAAVASRYMGNPVKATYY